jgi:hypothetical protein
MTKSKVLIYHLLSKARGTLHASSAPSAAIGLSVIGLGPRRYL